MEQKLPLYVPVIFHEIFFLKKNYCIFKRKFETSALDPAWIKSLVIQMCVVIILLNCY
jgi:hypothetical protein